MSVVQARSRRVWAAGLLSGCALLFLFAQQQWGEHSLAWALLALAAGVAATALLARRFGSGAQFGVSVLCSLALAEFVVPLVLNGPADVATVQYGPGYWSRGDLGTAPNEGQFRAVKTTLQGSVIYDVQYSVGPDRTRVTPGPPAGAAQAQDRVNFLGCSVTYGEGLQDAQTLPALFAQESALQSVPVQARNFAFHGYGPHQALAILQSSRDTAGKVNVFVTAPWHAMRSACKPNWTLGSPRFERDPAGSGVRRAGQCGDAGGLMPLPVARKLAQSAVYRTVRDVLWGRVADADMELYLALIREMAQVSHQRGQRFVVGFIKADDNFFQQTSFSNQRVLEAIQRDVDQVVDLTLADRAEAMERRHYLHELDRHPSAEANRERAVLLAQRLRPYLVTRASTALSPSP